VELSVRAAARLCLGTCTDFEYEDKEEAEQGSRISNCYAICRQTRKGIQRFLLSERLHSFHV